MVCRVHLSRLVISDCDPASYCLGKVTNGRRQNSQRVEKEYEHPLHGVHHEAASPNHRHLVQDLHAVPAFVFVLELKPATKWHKWTFLGGAEVVFFTSMLGGRVLIPPRPVRTANTVIQIWVIWVFLLKKFPDSKISSPAFQVLPSYFPNPMARKHWWDRSFRSFGFWANWCENYDCLSV